MKYILTILLSVSTLVLSAQSAERFFKAIETSDMAAIKSLLSTDVELCIRDKTDFLTRDEAVARIGKFLTTNTPQGLTTIHGGSNGKNDSKYQVARLKTSKGVYRVFVYMEGGQKIQEVRFDTF